MIPMRHIVAAVLAVGLFWLGWTVNGWRWASRVEAADNERAEQFEKRLKAAIDERDALAAKLKSSDDAHAAQMEQKQNEVTNLLDRVNSGAVRLRVAAKCPAATPAGMPAAASSPGLDDDARAELDPAARPAYRTLRAGIERCKVKIDALQEQLRLITNSPAP